LLNRSEHTFDSSSDLHTTVLVLPWLVRSRLLEVNARTIDQMPFAIARCHFVELAQ